MQKIIKTKSGIYILEVCAREAFRLDIKKYRDEILPQGYYYYVGSAQKNFYHRVKRHLHDTKTIHWHIDHLLVVPTNNIKTIYVLRNKPKEFECKMVSDLENKNGLTFPVKGFGNSDCRRCNSHLLYSRKKLSHNQFISLYQSIVRWIPSSNGIS
ncbi:DUF123 domain-containing protein [Bacteroidota bacterium]